MRYNPTLYIIWLFLAVLQNVAECRVASDPTFTLH